MCLNYNNSKISTLIKTYSYIEHCVDLSSETITKINAVEAVQSSYT